MYNFPDQTIPESKKNEDWHKQHIINFVSFSKSNSYTENKLEMERLYFAALAKIHPVDEEMIRKMITERYCDTNLGPSYDIYPLIENNIEQLIGDYRIRPLKMYALTQSPDAINSKLEEMYDSYLEKVTRIAHEEINNEYGIDIPTENPEMEVPEDDDEDFFRNYRTKSESIAEKILYFLLVIKKEKEKIYHALNHYLTVGIAHMLMGEKDGHPTIDVLNPIRVDMDINPNDMIQENPQYFAYSDPMSVNEIFNNYNLSKKQKDIVKNYLGSIKSDNFRGQIDTGWFSKSDNGSDLRINTITMLWKSRVKQKFLRIQNDMGREEMKIMPEDFTPRKNRDEVVEVEVENIRHCTMIGPDIVLEYGIQEDQLMAVGDKKKKFINVVSINNNNKTGVNEIRSIAKKLKFLQEWATEVLYEIKLAMRQIDGGVLVYDLANMPKEWAKLGVNKAIDRVNYYIKKERVMYINSADKRSSGYASAVNVSQKSRIGDLTALLGLIEEIGARVSGVNDSKRGENKDYAKTGVAEMNFMQASARTENIYGPFDTFVEKFLERIVLKAQNSYRKNQIISYYAGDNSIEFIEVKEPFFDDDLGVTLSDPRKEAYAKQVIDGAASQMLPNASDPKMILELIKVHMADSASDAKAILERGVEQMEKAAEERMAAEQQSQQAALEAAAAKEEKEDQLTRDGYEKDIVVAQIYANNKYQETQIKENAANLRKAAEIEAQEKMKDIENRSKNNQN